MRGVGRSTFYHAQNPKKEIQINISGLEQDSNIESEDSTELKMNNMNSNFEESHKSLQKKESQNEILETLDSIERQINELESKL